MTKKLKIRHLLTSVSVSCEQDKLLYTILSELQLKKLWNRVPPRPSSETSVTDNLSDAAGFISTMCTAKKIYENYNKKWKSSDLFLTYAPTKKKGMMIY